MEFGAWRQAARRRRPVAQSAGRSPPPEPDTLRANGRNVNDLIHPLRRLSCALFVLVCAASALVVADAAVAAAPRSGAPRLYVLDCGTISAMDPALFNLKPEEVNREVTFVSPCYLIVHPKGTLIWDVGQVPDKDIPDDGTEVVQQGILKAKRRLASQLAALGYQPKDITYMAMSHYHADHTANANLFAG
jgi:N-acyl homoserine lactone hydrolase